MRIYDPALVGWGCDWWFLHVLGPNLRGRVAIVDEVVCTNPLDFWKGGQREIDRLQTISTRRATWERIKQEKRICIEEQGTTEFGCIPKGAALQFLNRTTMVAESALLATIGAALRVVRRARIRT
jgi:hypothetical protein